MFVDNVELLGDTIVIHEEKCIIALSLNTLQMGMVSRNRKNYKSILFSEGFANEPGKLDGQIPWSSPSNMTLLLGRGCHLRCKYCYAHGGDTNPKMAEEVGSAAVEAYFSVTKGGKKIHFHGGGEPTLNFSLIQKLVESYTDKGVKWHLTTSGVMSEDVAKWFVSHKIPICISVDGPPSIQDSLRPLADGSPSSPFVERTYSIIRDAGQGLAARTTLVADSAERIDEILKYFGELGIQSVHIESLYTVGRAETERGIIRRPEELAWIAALVKALDWAKVNGKQVRVGELLYILDPGMKPYCGPMCGCTTTVTHEGDLTSCNEVVDSVDEAASLFHIGKLDLGEKSFKIDMRKAEILSRRVPANMAKCKDCFVKYVCRGGCPHKGYMATGDLLEPDPRHCLFIQTIIPMLIKRMVLGDYSDVVREVI